jgi:Pyridoxamine 5'-phosphate oxidase
MERLPVWERGTPAVLCVAGPHPIPVSTAVRAGDDRVVIALGRERETLRRLRADPAVALLVMGADVAFTAHGEARVVAEQLEAADTIVAVELRVARVQDHLADGRSVMLDGARWRWATEELAAADEATFAELERL